MMVSSAGSLKINIDLRKAWCTVRDQCGRQACLACATSDAHAYSQKRDQPLSAEFLFFHAGQLMPGKDVSKGLTFTAVDQALQTEGQPDEADWPFEPAPPTAWMPPTVSQRWFGLLKRQVAAVTQITKALESNTPVILGLRLTTDFLGLTTAPFVIPSSGKGFGGHAVLAVGLADHSVHGPLILLRNSWGAKWGQHGYGWLSTGYLHDKLIGQRIVDPLPTSKS